MHSLRKNYIICSIFIVFVISIILFAVIYFSSDIFKREYSRKTREDGRVSVIFYSLPTFGLIQRDFRGWVRVIDNKNGKVICESYLDDVKNEAQDLEFRWYPDADTLFLGEGLICSLP